MPRLATYLVDNKIIENLKKAEGLVLSGNVCVNDYVQDKLGYTVSKGDCVRLKSGALRELRGFQKIFEFLQQSDVLTTIQKKTAMDIGAAHGGFTKALLKSAVSRIIAVDVAYGIFDASLRLLDCIEIIERKNILSIDFKRDISFIPDFFVMDVSFISSKKVLLYLKKQVPTWFGFILFKPQFEVEPTLLNNGILSSDFHDDFLLEIDMFLESQKIKKHMSIPAAIKGKKGNQEFLYWLSWSDSQSVLESSF